MTRPKLFLAPVDTLRGNRAHEWKGTGPRVSAVSPCPERADRRAEAGVFWRWLTNLTREAARGHLVRPGGRAGW